LRASAQHEGVPHGDLPGGAIEGQPYAARPDVQGELGAARSYPPQIPSARGGELVDSSRGALGHSPVRHPQERGFRAIAYGINADDTRDFRPGHRAAHEHRILAPLLDAALSKPEIRILSRRAGLPTWDRPASACLSSRIPYGVAVTPELLAKIERAEAALRELAFRQFRVRAHGELARIELAPDELSRGLQSEMAEKIARGVKAAGFTFVTMDLEGYRQGSLNSLLKSKE